MITNFTGLVIPLPAVIISLSVKDYEYKIRRFPSGLCLTNGPMWFYSIDVIIDVLVGIGVYLLFIVFWIIHRVNIFLINFAIIIIVLEIYLPIKVYQKQKTVEYS